MIFFHFCSIFIHWSPVSFKSKQNADEAEEENMAVPLPARVLGLWSVTLITTIFLVVRADKESKWNFFVVFTPVLAYNGIAILVVMSRIVRHSRRGFHDNEQTVKRKFWFLLLLILSFILVCLICSKVHGLVTFPWYYVFLVLWILLILVLADITRFVMNELSTNR